MFRQGCGEARRTLWRNPNREISHRPLPHHDITTQSRPPHLHRRYPAGHQSDGDYNKIAGLVPGGPAERGGDLKTGDRIVAVAQGADGEEIDVCNLALAQTVELARGPKGTDVTLTVIPSGESEDSRKRITIRRDEIHFEDQEATARIVDLPAGGSTTRLGVIDLPAFYADEQGRGQSASADVATLIRKLKREDVRGIILDLRRNGGGSMQEAIDLTGLFIPSGAVVQTRDLSGRKWIGADEDGHTLYDGPLVVLTSRYSASASEIVAGALQDYGRALAVGDSSTFGKGTPSGQHTFQDTGSSTAFSQSLRSDLASVSPVATTL